MDKPTPYSVKKINDSSTVIINLVYEPVPIARETWERTISILDLDEPDCSNKIFCAQYLFTLKSEKYDIFLHSLRNPKTNEFYLTRLFRHRSMMDDISIINFHRKSEYHLDNFKLFNFKSLMDKTLKFTIMDCLNIYFDPINNYNSLDELLYDPNFEIKILEYTMLNY